MLKDPVWPSVELHAVADCPVNQWICIPMQGNGSVIQILISQVDKDSLHSRASSTVLQASSVVVLPAAFDICGLFQLPQNGLLGGSHISKAGGLQKKERSRYETSQAA